MTSKGGCPRKMAGDSMKTMDLVMKIRIMDGTRTKARVEMGWRSRVRFRAKVNGSGENRPPRYENGNFGEEGRNSDWEEKGYSGDDRGFRSCEHRGEGVILVVGLGVVRAADMVGVMEIGMHMKTRKLQLMERSKCE